MSGAKPPLGQLFQLMVFGPLGVALAVRDRLPELAAEGRAELDRQVRAARMIGTFAVTQARSEFDKRTAPRPQRPVAATAAESSTEAEPVAATAAESSTEAEPSAATAADSSRAIEPCTLIPGFDELTAAEIVRRLAPLSVADRNVIADYEREHRNRRTILGRIEQLRT